MIGVGFAMSQAKGLFFDRKKVRDAVAAAERKRLSQFGAYVRTRARTSIRKRKKPAPPGGPPHSHLGLLRRWILFAYDPSSHSVVIGPTRLNAVGNAPEALEYGGVSEVMVGRRKHRKKRRVVIKARPFMVPAFEAELQRLDPLWRDSIK